MEERSVLERAWDNISPSAAPPPLLYLDTLSATDFGQFYKHQTFNLLDVQPGLHVLDVGCGSGDDARAIARLVGDAGSVVGVDINPAMIQEARQRSAASTLPIEFRYGNAHQLPFADATFDRCRADRVFQHLEHPFDALREMSRVAKSGARLVISEPDWETLLIDHDDRATTRKIVNFICDSMVRNGWIGRQLPRLFKECGLTNIAVVTASFILTDYTLADRLWGLQRNAQRARDAGGISASECAAWLERLQQVAQTNHFFGTATGFGVCGQKP
jgi:ubiquinone/menaquinone biosynthesis C-methylase UbiE